MFNGNSEKRIPWYTTVLCGSIAGCTAELITFPIDTSKVRLQIQGQMVKPIDESCVKVIKYKGLTQSIQKIYLEEGLQSLWKGIFAGLQRQVLFAGLRIGLYPIIRDTLLGKSDPTLMKRVLSGMLTGAIGIILASPCDVVKVRLQAQGVNHIDVLSKYQGSIDAYKKISRLEGFKSFYAGLTPNIIRCSLMNSSELASYDQMKNYIARKYSICPSSKKIHILCATVASFIAVIISSPVDVIKTRLMNNTNNFSGTVDCFLKTFHYEGALAFYKGFWPYFIRVANWNIVMFLTLEQCLIVMNNYYAK